MSVCDVCNRELGEKEGYLLTTLEVVSTPGYWKKAFSGPMSAMISASGVIDDSFKTRFASRMASQTTPWMVCNDCINIFTVDKAKTRQYAIRCYESGTFTPPGSGAVPLSKVNMGDAKAYIQGRSPKAVELPNRLKSAQEHHVEKKPNNKDVEALIRALKHEDAKVKKQAVKVLGELGDPRAIESLIQAFKDWDLRELNVAASLAMIGEPAVESLLLAMEEPETRWGAITALGDIGDARAIYPLVKASGDLDSKIRGAAVIALGKIGDERIVQPLIGVLNVEEGVIIRQFAIEALGDIGDSRAIASLTQASKNEDASIRKHAEEALKKIKSKQFGKNQEGAAAKLKEPTKAKCKRCGQEMVGDDWVCHHCGRLDWSTIVTGTVLCTILVAIGAFVCNPGFWRWLWIGFGAILGVSTTCKTIQALTWSKKRKPSGQQTTNIPVFDIPSDVIRERLRSSIGGSAVSFSVRNGEVVEVKQKEAGKAEKEIRELARSSDDDSLLKLARMASQAVSTNDFDTFSTIRSELRTHVDIDRFSHVIRTHLSKSEQVAILNALSGENFAKDIEGDQDMTKKCAHCGSKFYEPKTMMDKVDFDAMQKVRVGCSKCGTAVCFSCAATAAGQRGKEGNCFCLKCGAELGRGGEAGELGEHFSGWN